MDSKDNAQEVQKRTLLNAAKKLLLSDMEALDSFADLQELPQDDQEGAFIRILAEHSEKVKNAAEGRTEDDGAQLEIILPDVDPKTNPNSPKFDPEAYKEAIDQAGGWQTFNASLQGALRDDFGKRSAELSAAGAAAAARILKGVNVEAFQKLIKQVQDVARRYGEAIKQAAEAMEKIRPAMEEMARNNWPGYNDAPEVAKTIAFGLAVLFAKAEAEGLDREGITITDVMENGFTDEWEPKPDSPYFDIAARAVDYAHVLLSAEEVEQIEKAIQEADAEVLPQIIARDTEKFLIPIDRSNNMVLWNPNSWSRAEEYNPDQLTFNVLLADDNQAAARFVYSFPDEDLDFPKKFDVYDRRVYFAVSSIYREIGPDMTLRQIFKTMTGSDTNPSKNDRDKIYKSLLRMRAAAVDVDCSEEVKAFKKEYDRRGIDIKDPVYSDLLLDWSSFTGKVNGRDALIIHIKNEPVLFNFARVRGQITAVKRELLGSPQNKTDEVLAIQSYLLYQISLKKGGKKKKLTYSTIFERCGITTRKQKERAIIKVKVELDHYKQNGFIEDFREYKADGKPAGVEIKRRENGAG